MKINNVINFLKANGFEKQETISYANDRCIVVIEKTESDEYYYSVSNNQGHVMYSDNLSIYWLIGVLTYCGYLDKEYRQYGKGNWVI